MGIPEHKYCTECGAAVMIPLIEKPDGSYDVLFEMRSRKLTRQPGEICFPGGRIEPGETAIECAVRETCEELLIKRDNISIFRELKRLTRENGTGIYPFAAVLNGYDGTWSADEVDHVFTLPLDWIASQEPKEYTLEVITRPGDDFPFDRIPGGRDYPWRIGKSKVYFYDYDEDGVALWGLTAEILKRFCEEAQAAEVRKSSTLHSGQTTMRR